MHRGMTAIIAPMLINSQEATGCGVKAEANGARAMREEEVIKNKSKTKWNKPWSLDSRAFAVVILLIGIPFGKGVTPHTR